MSVVERPLALPLPRSKSRRGGMGLVEAFRVALQGLLANKLRSVLTMLGIIIGVLSFIVMTAMGQGVAKMTREQIMKLGTNVMTIIPNSMMRGGVSQGLGTQQNLKLEDVDYVKRLCPSVKAVCPEVSKQGTVKFQNQNTKTTIFGTTPPYFEIRNMPIAQGRIFSEGEVRSRAKVAVIGDNIRETIFGGLQPVGKFLKVNGQSFKVVGVVEKRGGMGWRNPDDQVTIPVTTAMYRVFGQDYIGSISVQAVSEDKMIEAENEVKAAIAKAHKLQPGEDADVRVFNQKDITDTAAQQTGFLTMLLGGISLVSLIVGGIGIMNIMLVSVTERTREIGIRKAIGAKRRDILYQFLIESITLSVVGGLIGIGLGIYGANWASRPPDEGGIGFPMLLTLQPILVSFGFSVLVGIFFGIYPAMKASRLDPIEALRYE